MYHAEIPTNLDIIPGLRGVPGGQKTFGINGRNGSVTVIHVTTLDASGTGSFLEAIDTAGAKCIVFDVSGAIDISGFLAIDVSDCSIYGQTAPSPGITFIQTTLLIRVDDVLIQHIAVRTGDLVGVSGSDADCIQVFKSATTLDNIIVDHVSCAWSSDEIIDGSGVGNLTISNCVLAEGLNEGLQSAHSKGPFLTDVSNFLIYQNLISTSDQRTPAVGPGSVGKVVNNLIYNGQGFGGENKFMAMNHGTASSTASTIDFQGNDLKAGPNTNSLSTTGILYIGNNGPASGNTYHIDDTRHLFTLSPLITNASGEVDASETEVHPLPGLLIRAASGVLARVTVNAGFRVADADPTDVRMRGHAVNADAPSGISGNQWVDTQASSGTGSISTNTGANFDSDGYPSPAANTSTANVPTNPGEVLTSGYTRFEEWIHGLSKTVETAP